jgi:heme exporter protein B
VIKHLLGIFYLELQLSLRRSFEWTYPLVFFVIIMCLFPLAFTPNPSFLSIIVPGCTWMAALLASLLSLENIFFGDFEDGCLEQMLLSNVPLPLLILIKLVVKWIVTQLPLIILVPLLGLLFHLSWQTIWVLSLGLTLGTPILILVGCLGAALTLGVKQSGALLGLLILPLNVPVLIFGVSMVEQSTAGFKILGPLSFLAGLCIFAVLFLPLTIAKILRLMMDD